MDACAIIVREGFTFLQLFATIAMLALPIFAAGVAYGEWKAEP